MQLEHPTSRTGAPRPRRSDTGCARPRQTSAEAPPGGAARSNSTSTRRHSSPSRCAPANNANDGKKKKFKRLQEELERRLDIVQDFGGKSLQRPASSTSTKCWREEVQAKLQGRLEEWGLRLSQEQFEVQAKADQALDLAAEASRACLVMAKQLQDVSVEPLCTMPQVQTLLQDKLDEIQKVWKAGVESDKAQRVRSGASPQPAEEGDTDRSKAMASVFNNLNDRLGDWVSAVESRLSDVEQVVWTATHLAADRKTPTSEPWQSESATVQRLCLAISKLEVEIENLGKNNAEQREDMQRLGVRLHKEIEDINGSLRDVLSTHLLNIEKHANQAFGGDETVGEAAADRISMPVQQASGPEAAVATCPMATVVRPTSPSQHSPPPPARFVGGSARAVRSLPPAQGQQGGSYVPVASVPNSSLHVAPSSQQLHGNWRYPHLSRPSSPTGSQAHASHMVVQGGQTSTRQLR
mmetsp:Transcript_81204/g.161034  ORF Transcript_81204/g.161034 Transcript_81204/m.161034 type:complete len:467 (+) Transcript_81204:44-1444(+)